MTTLSEEAKKLLKEAVETSSDIVMADGGPDGLAIFVNGKDMLRPEVYSTPTKLTEATYRAAIDQLLEHGFMERADPSGLRFRLTAAGITNKDDQPAQRRRIGF